MKLTLRLNQKNAQKLYFILIEGAEAMDLSNDRYTKSLIHKLFNYLKITGISRTNTQKTEATSQEGTVISQ